MSEITITKINEKSMRKKTTKRPNTNKSIKDIQSVVKEEIVEDNVIDYELVSNAEKNNGINNGLSNSSVNISALNIDTNTIIIPHNFFGNQFDPKVISILSFKFRQLLSKYLHLFDYSLIFEPKEQVIYEFRSID